MQGAKAHCMRYGHDWKVESMFDDPEDEHIVWECLHCMRCDTHALYARFHEGKQ